MRCRPVEQSRDIRWRGSIAAEQAVGAEREQVAADDVGRRRLDDRILVGQPGRRLGEQRRELLGGPERGQVEALC
jgi:hypothetical protein